MKISRKHVLNIVLLVLLLPFVLAQLNLSERRQFEWVSLDETSYQEIHFENKVQGIDLAGMLFVPEGTGPFPAAVIIHGSGTSQRDSGWYLTLTQYLQKNGILVLLPDKRGSVDSGGDWYTSSLEDLATDTLAAVEFLQRQDLADITQIGLIGMSEGGRIAPIAATQSTDIAYVVNVVGGALPSYDALYYEETHNLEEMGFLPGISNMLAYPTTFILINVTKADFWDAVGNFDPLPYWKKVEIPSLFLFGQEDSNVPSEESALRLNALNKSNIEVIVYSGSGHALEAPEGKGASIFREDAMQKIRGLIYALDPG